MEARYSLGSGERQEKKGQIVPDPVVRGLALISHSPAPVSGLVLWLALFACAGDQARAQSADLIRPPYEIKAAWLVNFARFVEWPESALQEKLLRIAIIGEEPDLTHFGSERISLGSLDVVITRVRPDQQAALREAHILFINRSARHAVDEIIASVEDLPILTVSEIGGFLERGGSINFVIVDDSVRFEINRDASIRRGLRIPSPLLVRAHKVISMHRE